uniref:Uncharacterized protein n=1 Tax=Arundo donax TaxID=35708 RepID=A0A0A9C8L7_ARUDO
MHSALPFWGEV